MVYEFQCKECGATVENFQPDAEIIHCSKRMQRIYSIAGILFKGPGFHYNDKKTPGNPHGS